MAPAALAEIDEVRGEGSRSIVTTVSATGTGGESVGIDEERDEGSLSILTSLSDTGTGDESGRSTGAR